jgi:hypothetical protein
MGQSTVQRELALSNGLAVSPEVYSLCSPMLLMLLLANPMSTHLELMEVLSVEMIEHPTGARISAANPFMEE